MNCIEGEVLSAYADGECVSAEREAVEKHLPACADCRARLAELRALKAAAASAFPSPSLSPALARALLAPGARRRGWGDALAALRESLLRPAAGFAFAAAALALGVWFTRADEPLGAPELPVELLLSAHEDYARTLPLAAREDAPLSADDDEAADD